MSGLAAAERTSPVDSRTTLTAVASVGILGVLSAFLMKRLGETEAKLAKKPFSPLPLLGVPGWWPDNEDPSFYDDASVFRAKRRPSAIEKPHADQDYEPLS